MIRSLNHSEAKCNSIQAQFNPNEASIYPETDEGFRKGSVSDEPQTGGGASAKGEPPSMDSSVLNWFQLYIMAQDKKAADQAAALKAEKAEQAAALKAEKAEQAAALKAEKEEQSRKAAEQAAALKAEKEEQSRKAAEQAAALKIEKEERRLEKEAERKLESEHLKSERRAEFERLKIETEVSAFLS